eukprot:CAMPEP_0174894766 /NCGR_PEP_ID=MMETSP0167-20121228/9320_1 /TAXON_ID=38298 /ORGANISM="Rhodella maculata, Strain CCMP736" /LENGTH=391 /DNA_ID=CAMNT_0016133927 /DNA_START=1 /DNA_END=1176 /DNA_ORIENTATION=+
MDTALAPDQARAILQSAVTALAAPAPRDSDILSAAFPATPSALITAIASLNPAALAAHLHAHLASRTTLLDDPKSPALPLGISESDLLAYAALHSWAAADSTVTPEDRGALADTWRWFDLVQNDPAVMGNSILKAIPFGLDLTEDDAAAGSRPAASGAPAPATASADAGAGETEEERKAEEKREKARAKKAEKAAEKAKQKAERNSAAEGGATPAAGASAAKPATAEDTVARIDIRVGRILEASPHPDAESLYVEKIDVGEPEPRVVCSGLVKAIPDPAKLLGPCIVICNLKPVNMRGVKSHAMVLCATDDTKAVVELVMPPEGAAPGDRVVCDGFEGEPDAQLNPKKKVWEKIQPDFSTSADGVATWKDSPMKTDKGVCTAPTVRGGTLS